mgnify:CR=1 FL=1
MPYTIHGHHIVVGAPGPDGTRKIVEVFALEDAVASLERAKTEYADVDGAILDHAQIGQHAAALDVVQPGQPGREARVRAAATREHGGE